MKYEEKVPFAKEEDGTPELLAASIKILQQNIGSLLFYGRDMDMSLLVAIMTLDSTQVHITEATARAILQLLNHCATHLDAIIGYKQSSMVLAINSDALCLYDTKANS